MSLPNQKPFAPAADRNRVPILKALRKELDGTKRVLEFASGTGQHICYFAQHLAHIIWQPSERVENLSVIQAWIDDAECDNILSPITLDLSTPLDRSLLGFDACYAANILHIVPWQLVENLFKNAAHILSAGNKLFVYGPYRLHGQHISVSNADFDRSIRKNYPGGGIRDIKDLDDLAISVGFDVARSIVMPANNYLMVWQRIDS